MSEREGIVRTRGRMASAGLATAVHWAAWFPVGPLTGLVHFPQSGLQLLEALDGGFKLRLVAQRGLGGAIGCAGAGLFDRPVPLLDPGALLLAQGSAGGGSE